MSALTSREQHQLQGQQLIVN